MLVVLVGLRFHAATSLRLSPTESPVFVRQFATSSRPRPSTMLPENDSHVPARMHSSAVGPSTR
jgi:hypothetical protein